MTIDRLSIRCLAAVLLAAVFAALSGCAVFGLYGAMKQNEEYQKEIEVLPVYDDLGHKRVAVVVNTDMGTLYQFPTALESISQGVALRVQKNVPDVIVLSPAVVSRWQYLTPQWNTLTYGEMAEQLNVDRVIYVDLYEFRLNPPGNAWQWEGVAAANIGIIEREGYGSDLFADEFHVVAKFPDLSNVTRESASAEEIQFGLLADFIKRASWLFYRHLEPKHPDKFDARFKTTTDADLDTLD